LSEIGEIANTDLIGFTVWYTNSSTTQTEYSRLIGHITCSFGCPSVCLSVCPCGS